VNNFLGAIKVKLAQTNRRFRDFVSSEELTEVKLETRIEEGTLWLDFSSGERKNSITIPIPYTDENKNLVIGRRVVRAVGTWHVKEKERSYWEMMEWLLTDNIEDFIPKAGPRVQLERAIKSMYQPDTAYIFRGVQEVITKLVNDLPLCGTALETWAMCHRVVFIDPNFNEIMPPEAALSYQIEQNKKFFPWTSLGLSDSGMTNNNLLKCDLRTLTPFGLNHHNPQRNLYQPLGMRGEEKPVILTKTAAKMEEQGIGHTGWNWLTCYLDLPGTFEDQLLIDLRHMDKFSFEEQQIICFGEVQIKAGDQISEGDIISMEPSGTPLRFRLTCDSATVQEVYKDKIVFNSQEREVNIVSITSKHLFKEGIKLTNRHGNKGVAAFADLGTAFDPVRGELPIDIIVSAKTISKRRNYGQVLEALTTLYCGLEKRLVIPDDVAVNQDKLIGKLAEKGYINNGSIHVKTQWGEFDTLVGWCFWGLLRNPELQLWTEEDVVAVDNRGLRPSGSKVSHIELKALTTMFGDSNPVIQEILSHRQGVEDVGELLIALDILRGREIELPILNALTIKPIDQQNGFFHTPAELSNTVADEHLLPGGFMMELPQTYHVFIPANERNSITISVLTDDVTPAAVALGEGKNVFLNKIYVPSTVLRGSWQHPTGLWGLSDLSGHLNNIVKACHLPKEERTNALHVSIDRYFTHISSRLGSKAGEVSLHCLSIRYANSAKATATLSLGDLPTNWVEIHEEMAQTLGVKTGDYILAERFPCLGFMSLRVQRVRVSSDPQCRYVIRVSGNSLVSQNLDFDGDVLFLLSFHTPGAKEVLERDFHNPEPERQKFIDANAVFKQPIIGPLDMPNLRIERFPILTKDRQAEIVADLTGVKRGTGAIVALSYNVMRIVEGRVSAAEVSTNVAIEVILDRVANSVFSRKHAGVSLADKSKEAICLADLKSMLEMGFPENGSSRLCEIVRQEAAELGVSDLKAHYEKHLTENTSNIISKIIRSNHRLYYATRSKHMDPVRLLEHLERPGNDLCVALFNTTGLIQYDSKMPTPQDQECN
jgi:hypothetical protein